MRPSGLQQQSRRACQSADKYAFRQRPLPGRWMRSRGSAVREVCFESVQGLDRCDRHQILNGVGELAALPGIVHVRGTVSDASTAGFTVVTSAGTRVPVTTSGRTVVSVFSASVGQLQAGASTIALGYARPHGTLSAIAVFQPIRLFHPRSARSARQQALQPEAGKLLACLDRPRNHGLASGG
jgi:hypothetical protein